MRRAARGSLRSATAAPKTPGASRARRRLASPFSATTAAAAAPPPPRPFGWVPFLGAGGGGGASAEASPLPTSPQDVLLVNFVIALMLGAYMVLLATFSPGWSLGRVGIIAANIGSILLGSSSSAADADGPLTAVEDRLLLITALALGVCVAHVLEREKRGHMLELMRLTRQLRASSDFGSFAANASEKAALETALGSPLLSDKILKARVDLADLRARDKALGHGAFGTVRAAEWRGERVAVKQLHRNRINERDLHAFTRSAELELSIGAHENVVRLLGLAWSIDSALVISVMELCGGGTLAEALDTKQLGGTGADALHVAAGLARGLAFLHAQSPPIIHRDLKPSNVLLDDGPQHLGPTTAKIADFGTSRFRALESTMSGGMGTPLFSAPELLLGGWRYDQSVDVWSLGCVLACLQYECSLPYPPELCSDQGFLARVAAGAVRPDPPGDSWLPPLVRECCKNDAAERPSAAEVDRALSRRLERPAAAVTPFS